jgi:hypothetical protein
VVKLFRIPHIQSLLSSLLLSLILNYSINTIDTGFILTQKITSLTEIESFSEFILEEVFALKGVVADCDGNDQDHCAAGIQIILFNYATIDYSFQTPLSADPSPLHNKYSNSYTSRQKEIEGPPPKKA